MGSFGILERLVLVRRPLAFDVSLSLRGNDPQGKFKLCFRDLIIRWFRLTLRHILNRGCRHGYGRIARFPCVKQGPFRRIGRGRRGPNVHLG